MLLCIFFTVETLDDRHRRVKLRRKREERRRRRIKEVTREIQSSRLAENAILRNTIHVAEVNVQYRPLFKVQTPIFMFVRHIYTPPPWAYE